MLFKKTIIAAWMASLLLSTAGVSIHRVYCYCTKTAAVSVFFSPEDDCEKSGAAGQMDCCKKLVSTKTCCEKPIPGLEKKHNCTDRSTAFAKLELKFTQSEFFPQLPDFQWVAAVQPPVFFEINFTCPAKKLLLGNKAPPNRASGRELRQQICSYQL